MNPTLALGQCRFVGGTPMSSFTEGLTVVMAVAIDSVRELFFEEK